MCVLLMSGMRSPEESFLWHPVLAVSKPALHQHVCMCSRSDWKISNQSLKNPPSTPPPLCLYATPFMICFLWCGHCRCTAGCLPCAITSACNHTHHRRRRSRYTAHGKLAHAYKGGRALVRSTNASLCTKQPCTKQPCIQPHVTLCFAS